MTFPTGWQRPICGSCKTIPSQFTLYRKETGSTFTRMYMRNLCPCGSLHQTCQVKASRRYKGILQARISSNIWNSNYNKEYRILYFVSRRWIKPVDRYCNGSKADIRDINFSYPFIQAFIEIPD